MLKAREKSRRDVSIRMNEERAPGKKRRPSPPRDTQTGVWEGGWDLRSSA